MKRTLLAVAAVVAMFAAVGCVSQTAPKQGSTTQGVTAPRDTASGQTGK